MNTYEMLQEYIDIYHPEAILYDFKHEDINIKVTVIDKITVGYFYIALLNLLTFVYNKTKIQ